MTVSYTHLIYRDVCGESTDMEIPILHGDGHTCFWHKVRSFLDAIKNGGTAPVPTSQILYNQAILDGIVRSAELGKEIEIQIPEI